MAGTYVIGNENLKSGIYDIETYISSIENDGRCSIHVDPVNKIDRNMYEHSYMRINVINCDLLIAVKDDLGFDHNSNVCEALRFAEFLKKDILIINAHTDYNKWKEIVYNKLINLIGKPFKITLCGSVLQNGDFKIVSDIYSEIFDNSSITFPKICKDMILSDIQRNWIRKIADSNLVIGIPKEDGSFGESTSYEIEIARYLGIPVITENMERIDLYEKIKKGEINKKISSNMKFHILDMILDLIKDKSKNIVY